MKGKVQVRNCRLEINQGLEFMRATFIRSVLDCDYWTLCSKGLYQQKNSLLIGQPDNNGNYLIESKVQSCLWLHQSPVRHWGQQKNYFCLGTPTDGQLGRLRKVQSGNLLAFRIQWHNHISRDKGLKISLKFRRIEACAVRTTDWNCRFRRYMSRLGAAEKNTDIVEDET